METATMDLDCPVHRVCEVGVVVKLCKPATLEP